MQAITGNHNYIFSITLYLSLSMLDQDNVSCGLCCRFPNFTHSGTTLLKVRQLDIQCSIFGAHQCN